MMHITISRLGLRVGVVVVNHLSGLIDMHPAHWHILTTHSARTNLSSGQQGEASGHLQARRVVHQGVPRC
jgi:hypothetical protein